MREGLQKFRIIIALAVMVNFFAGCKKDKNINVTNNTGTTGSTGATGITASPGFNVIPASALPNSVISIKGSNFNTTLANNTVTINGVMATINSISATDVEVTIPATATSGTLTLVTNGVMLIYPNFKVMAATTVLPLGPLLNNLYFEHIAISYTENATYQAVFGDNGGNSLFSFSTTYNAAGLYIGDHIGWTTIGGNTTRFWGIAATNFTLYATAINEYKIYSISISPIGTGIGSPIGILAGSGISGYTEGQGTAAQFIAPRGLAIDSMGNLYVNDARRVRKITSAGVVSTLAGSSVDGNSDGQGTTATFGNLEGIAVDAIGNVYVSDDKYLNIRKITSTGTVTTLAGSGTAGFADGIGKAAQFYFPKGMAVDAAGNVFVSDSNYNNPSGPYTSAIRMINKLGVVTTFLNSNTSTSISNPNGIAFNRAGSMSICNTGPGTANQYITGVNFSAK